MRTLGTALALMAAASAARAWTPLTGKDAIPIKVDEWINGAEGQTLEDLKGKVILLEFWATW